MDHFKRHEREMRELERKGWEHVDTIPLDAVNSQKSKGKYPEKTRWFYTTGAVYAPPSKGN